MAEGVPPGLGGGATFGGQGRGQPVYKPETNVPNSQAKTAVAKQGFLIKSSAGKKDSVSQSNDNRRSATTSDLTSR